MGESHLPDITAHHQCNYNWSCLRGAVFGMGERASPSLSLVSTTRKPQLWCQTHSVRRERGGGMGGRGGCGFPACMSPVCTTVLLTAGHKSLHFVPLSIPEIYSCANSALPTSHPCTDNTSPSSPIPQKSCTHPLAKEGCGLELSFQRNARALHAPLSIKELSGSQVNHTER